MLVRVLFGVVRVPRLFLQPERAHIANHLQRLASAHQAHILLHNLWRCHMDLPVGPGEEVVGFER